MDKEQQFAFGELALKPYEYWCLTDYEYNAMCAGYIRKESRRKEDVRMIGYLLYCGFGGNKDGIEITEWWKLPTDEIVKKPGNYKRLKKDLQDTLKMWAELDKQKKDGNGKTSD